MKAKVYSHLKFIGTTDLLIGDESMGCVYGDFNPNENYFQYVQPAVWKFWEDQKEGYKHLLKLRLNVQLENGYFLYAAGGITFDDIKELPDEPNRIDIAGLDRIIFDKFFIQNPIKSFVGEPWECISIEEKIAFEDELNLELGLKENKKKFNLFKNKVINHELLDFYLSALCKDQRNDDVLFVSRNRETEIQFVIVHLTWKSKKEIDGFPYFQSFKDFQSFIERSKLDRKDWLE